MTSIIRSGLSFMMNLIPYNSILLVPVVTDVPIVNVRHLSQSGIDASHSQ